MGRADLQRRRGIRDQPASDGEFRLAGHLQVDHTGHLPIVSAGTCIIAANRVGEVDANGVPSKLS